MSFSPCDRAGAITSPGEAEPTGLRVTVEDRVRPKALGIGVLWAAGALGALSRGGRRIRANRDRSPLPPRSNPIDDPLWTGRTRCLNRNTARIVSDATCRLGVEASLTGPARSIEDRHDPLLQTAGHVDRARRVDEDVHLVFQRRTRAGRCRVRWRSRCGGGSGALRGFPGCPCLRRCRGLPGRCYAPCGDERGSPATCGVNDRAGRVVDLPAVQRTVRGKGVANAGIVLMCRATILKRFSY